MKGDRRLGRDESRVRRGLTAAAVSVAVAVAVSLPMAFQVAEADQADDPSSTTSEVDVIAVDDGDETDGPETPSNNTPPSDTAPVSILPETTERDDPPSSGG